MQRLEVSGAVRPIHGSLAVKRLKLYLEYGGSGDRGGTVVKALCYKSEGRWFDRTMALGSTQPLTEMSTRSISWG